MRTVVMSILTALLVVGASTMGAAPDQSRPGEPTDAAMPRRFSSRWAWLGGRRRASHGRRASRRGCCSSVRAEHPVGLHSIATSTTPAWMSTALSIFRPPPYSVTV